MCRVVVTWVVMLCTLISATSPGWAVSAGESGGSVNTKSVPDRMPLSEGDARAFLHWMDKEATRVMNHQALSEWAYSTNITQHNEQLMIAGRMKTTEFMKTVFNFTSKHDWQSVRDASIRRQFKLIAEPGNTVLSEEKLKRMLSTEAKMMKIYSTAEICGQNGSGTEECMTEKEVMDIFARAVDETELRRLWKLWHKKVGRNIRPYFRVYVQLSNEMAVGNNYSDCGEMWRNPYESETLEEDVKKLWDQLKPFYQQLHAYARKKLVAVYGADVVPPRGLIPAHLLGDILAFNWGGIDEPYTNIALPNITEEMERQGYTVHKIVEVAEDFFVSLGFPKMPRKFWKKSMFEKPDDGRDVMCHGTAWNFYDADDYRILICSDVSAGQLYTIHHEIGHLHYYMQYDNASQPYPFQSGANPAFHEAIGDAILLSVMTEKHLHSIGLMEETVSTPESDINFLFTEALSSVTSLPMSYVIDAWRWDVFRGEIPYTKWNKKWWELRESIQGLSAPVPRSEHDLDAGTIFHVATFSPFLRYFISEIIKHQFHRALCKTAGQYDPDDPSKPLFKCDIFNSKEAGQQLRDMLRLGASKHWTYAMRLITKGEEDSFDPSALLEYFKPLMDFLVEDNARTGEVIGWDHPNHKQHPRPAATSGSSRPNRSSFEVSLFGLISIVTILLGKVVTCTYLNYTVKQT